MVLEATLKVLLTSVMVFLIPGVKSAQMVLVI